MCPMFWEHLREDVTRRYVLENKHSEYAFINGFGVYAINITM